nr:hypothetical protein [Candidatus Njordarchaeum guaymaensis]
MALGKFDWSLLVWGIISSLLVLVSFLIYGPYSLAEAPEISAARVLFAYIILVAIVGGAFAATIYIARKA